MNAVAEGVLAELWVTTSYFNPSAYRTKRQNYAAFMEGLRAAGVPCLTVECAFGDAPFDLPASDRVLQVRAKDVLWQKERLLNVAIGALPPECTKVAWLDCDILFDDPGWARETAALLDIYCVVQPFGTVVRLPRGMSHDDGRGKRWSSFGTVYLANPTLAASGLFEPHGHTGFAWAARRAFLDSVGLYDVCIAGSADHLMAHAFAGNVENDCVVRMLGADGPYREHFLRWAARAEHVVQGKLGSGVATVRHLWHGDDNHRQYVSRNTQLQGSGFDPDRDLRVGSDGCWEWQAADPPLRGWMIDYFAKRCEDGDGTEESGDSPRWITIEVTTAIEPDAR
jgi:hypothetical protein